MAQFKPLQPSVIVIFGALGDLAKRKLMPALYNLYLDKMLPEKFSIVGLGRDCNEEGFREQMLAGVSEFSRRGKPDATTWQKFVNNVTFIEGGFEEEDLYARIRVYADKEEKTFGTPATRVHYLSVAPGLIETITDNLDKAGLSKENDRVVIEKPFGRDLESATELNSHITRCFEESQIYRIDHYLGKETVQNILAFRFANAMQEPIWNRRYIDHVQITVAEEVGVELRGKFYETAGALRDMIQNHLLQLLCMVAMEPPISFDPDEVRSKKVDVLKAIRPIPSDQIYRYAVRGQYGPGYAGGKVVPGYRDEPGVDPDSSIETFVALKFYVDNWRWQDVPFYLRTGKRMPTRASQISIEFRPVPHQMFPDVSNEHWEPNRLTINIQPHEGITMRLQAKQPGQGMRLRSVQMKFDYEGTFKGSSPEAYETLLFDVLEGDSTLFMRADQEHCAWTVVTPILNAWEGSPSQDFPNYAAGSWGPEAAEALIARDGRSWHAVPLSTPKDAKI